MAKFVAFSFVSHLKACMWAARSFGQWDRETTSLLDEEQERELEVEKEDSTGEGDFQVAGRP